MLRSFLLQVSNQAVDPFERRFSGPVFVAKKHSVRIYIYYYRNISHKSPR